MDIETQLKNFLKHALTYASGDLLRKVVGFLMIPIYTRYLMTTGYGVLEIMDSTVTVIALFWGLRISSAVVRFYYEYDEEKEKQEVISTALIAIFITAIFLVIISQCISDKVSYLIFDTPYYEKYFKIAFVTLALSLICGVPESSLIAGKRSMFYTCINVFVFVSYLSLNIFFVVFAKKGILGILYSSLITKSAYTIFLCFWFLVNHKVSFSFNKLKNMIKYGLPLLPASIGMFILNYSDRFILQKLTTSAEVGIYALGYKLAFMLAFLVIEPVKRILDPQMFDISRESNGRDTMSKMFTYLVLILVFCGLGLASFAKPAINIMATPAFYPAVKAIPFILLGYILMGASTFFQSALMITKRTHYIGLSVILAAITNPIFNLLLIPKYGAMGAAYSTAISFLSMLVIVYYFSQKSYHIDCEWSRILKIVTCGLFLFFLDQIIAAEKTFVSIIYKLFLLGSFPILLYFLNFFTGEEMHSIRVTASRWRRRFRILGDRSENILKEL
ncbi:hypothetical protein AMJ44_02205 [candidate division WOR-1 bacterium DG_54_3]|uniref:Uncharacterized protein n=1 Tax=candidate division WOR-1 bacterium DG_54_3 TaxID=1703775 RepID=A0A0S7Y5S6_UNCSA|nr:MAG: hypothetical protein AMJ44_02205 [candidate division WOR-1 bacterium DG_54_3]